MIREDLEREIATLQRMRRDGVDTGAEVNACLDYIAALTAERDAAVAELAHLRKLEAWARGFVANAPVNRPQASVAWLAHDHNKIELGAVTARYKIAAELRALLAGSEVSE